MATNLNTNTSTGGGGNLVWDGTRWSNAPSSSSGTSGSPQSFGSSSGGQSSPSQPANTGPSGAPRLPSGYSWSGGNVMNPNGQQVGFWNAGSNNFGFTGSNGIDGNLAVLNPGFNPNGGWGFAPGTDPRKTSQSSAAGAGTPIATNLNTNTSVGGNNQLVWDGTRWTNATAPGSNPASGGNHYGLRGISALASKGPDTGSYALNTTYGSNPVDPPPGDPNAVSNGPLSKVPPPQNALPYDPRLAPAGDTTDKALPVPNNLGPNADPNYDMQHGFRSGTPNAATPPVPASPASDVDPAVMNQWLQQHPNWAPQTLQPWVNAHPDWAAQHPNWQTDLTNNQSAPPPGASFGQLASLSAPPQSANNGAFDNMPAAPSLTNPFAQMLANNPYTGQYQQALMGQGIANANQQYANADAQLRAEMGARGLGQAGLSGVEDQARTQLSLANAQARTQAANDALMQTTQLGANYGLQAGQGFLSGQQQMALLPGQAQAQAQVNQEHQSNLNLIANNWQGIQQKLQSGIALSNAELAQKAAIAQWAQQHPDQAWVLSAAPGALQAGANVLGGMMNAPAGSASADLLGAVLKGGGGLLGFMTGGPPGAIAGSAAGGFVGDALAGSA